MERSQPTVPTKLEEQRTQLFESEMYFRSINNPTTVELDNPAKLILLNMNEDKPIKVTGIVPEWTAPKGIALREQIGITPRTWILVAYEPSPLEALLAGR